MCLGFTLISILMQRRSKSAATRMRPNYFIYVVKVTGAGGGRRGRRCMRPCIDCGVMEAPRALTRRHQELRPGRGELRGAKSACIHNVETPGKGERRLRPSALPGRLMPLGTPLGRPGNHASVAVLPASAEGRKARRDPVWRRRRRKGLGRVSVLTGWSTRC